MKLKKEEYSWALYFDKEGNHFIEFINEWFQGWGKWNWYDFTLIEISFINDIMVPGYEFIFIILGLGFRLRINRIWSGTKLQKSINEVEKYEK